MKLTYLCGHEPRKGRCPIAANHATTATLGTQPAKRLIIDWDKTDWGIIACWVMIAGLGVFGLYGLFGPVGPQVLLVTAAAWAVYGLRGAVDFVQCWKSRRGQLLAAIRLLLVVVTVIVGISGTFAAPAFGLVLLWIVVGVCLYRSYCGPLGVMEIRASLIRDKKGTTPHG